MKEKVLEFLRGKGLPEERYNEAMFLYRKSEGKSVATVNSYSRAGFTAGNLKNICYDLQKLYSITDTEIADVSKAKGKKGNDAAEKLKKLQEKKDAALKALVHYDPEETKYNDAKKIVIGLGLELDNMRGGTIKVALIAAKEEFITESKVDSPETVVPGTKTGDSGTKTDQSGPDFIVGAVETEPTIEEKLSKTTAEEKKGLTLRVRFPFLSEEDCPDKFKILVADMLTAWDKFRAAHTELFKIGDDKLDLTNAEIYALGRDAIDNFEKNHAIWDELEYYDEHKEILGNHPIFADDILKQAVTAMTDTIAIKRRNTLRTYISREGKKLNKDGIAEDKAKTIKEKINKYNQELNLLKKRLGEK